MRKILLALSLLTTVSLHALTVDEMQARFNKVKEKSKSRHGTVMESYVNVHSELAPGRSGSYAESDFGRTLTLEVHADGEVSGRGAEKGHTFELCNGPRRRVAPHRDEAVRRWHDGTAGGNLHQPAEDRGTNGPRDYFRSHHVRPRRHERRFHVRRRDLRQALLRAKVMDAGPSSLDEQIVDKNKGIDAGEPMISEKAKVVMIKDPEGNSIAFAEAIDQSMAR